MGEVPELTSKTMRDMKDLLSDGAPCSPVGAFGPHEQPSPVYETGPSGWAAGFQLADSLIKDRSF